MYGPLENYHNLLRMTRSSGWPNAQMYQPSFSNLGATMGGPPGTAWHSQPASQATIVKRTGSRYGIRRRYTRPRARPWPQPGTPVAGSYTQPATWYDAPSPFPRPGTFRPNIAPGPFGFLLKPALGVTTRPTIGGMTPSFNNPSYRRY